MKNVMWYDEFNIYNKPSREELKKYMAENKSEGQTGEEIANETIKEFNLDEDYQDMLNDLLDELGIL